MYRSDAAGPQPQPNGAPADYKPWVPPSRELFPRNRQRSSGAAAHHGTYGDGRYTARTAPFRSQAPPPLSHDGLGVGRWAQPQGPHPDSGNMRGFVPREQNRSQRKQDDREFGSGRMQGGHKRWQRAEPDRGGSRGDAGFADRSEELRREWQEPKRRYPPGHRLHDQQQDAPQARGRRQRPRRPSMPAEPPQDVPIQLPDELTVKQLAQKLGKTLLALVPSQLDDSLLCAFQKHETALRWALMGQACAAAGLM